MTSRQAVVIGGSSGIGDAVVKCLLDDGDDVVVLDRVEPRLTGARYIECDLLNQANVSTALDELRTPIDVVAYVAGIPGTHSPSDVMTVNFLALREVLKSIEPRMANGGAIAIVASTAGTAWTHRVDVLNGLLTTATIEAGLAWQSEADPQYPHYNASKEAAILFAKRWAPQLWSQRGIRINSISPGPVATAILADFEESMGKEMLDGVRSQIGRHANPEDIAPVVVAALSPAFGWVTGQDIQVDAGYVNSILHGAATEVAN